MMDANFENWVREAAAGMAYPPTPDIAAGVRRRLAERRPSVAAKPWYANRLAWAVTAVLLAVALLLAVPQARAAIFEFFQIGDIRIFPAEATATPVDGAAVVVTATPIEASQTVAAESPSPPAFSIANLYGESTLAEIQAELGEAFIRPDYPTGIGLPDRVFLQELGGPVGIMAWMETDSVEKAWAILYILKLGQGAFGGKFHVDSLQGTEVNGQPAYWVEGEHLLSFYDEDGRVIPVGTRLVEGNTLIWTVEDVTYRLESILTMEDAVRMAESMK